ncbi:MAG: FAD-dependent oxidoreductase [Gammaproteobacteria bacterium]|nr:FAD-dependent oxidoreductase [Gammaproteobacteria bacterium]
MQASSAESEFDVVIVGSGMVGASLACALADSGLRLAVLDSQPFAAPDAVDGSAADLADQAFDPRVSAITPASQQFLNEIGVWDAIAVRRCSPYTDMHVWDGDGTGSIHFSATDIHADLLGHIIENSVIVAALQQRLRQSIHESADITLLAPVSLSGLRAPTTASQGTPVQIELADGSRLTTRLLVAADGANSTVRELAGFQTREWDYEHHAIVTTVRTQFPHRQTAIQRFMDKGVLAFLPLRTSLQGGRDDQRHCSIVWSVLPELAQALMALDDAAFARELQAAIENRLGTIESVDKRYSFPLRQRHAHSYVQQGIALIGDAAHTIHPLAGQGVNLGLQDASVLAAEILQALSKGRDFADLRTLRRYQRRRIGHNLGMMCMMEGFKRLFAEQPLAVRWLRNAGMAGLDKTVLIKNHIMRSAMGIE